MRVLYVILTGVRNVGNQVLLALAVLDAMEQPLKVCGEAMGNIKSSEQPVSKN